MSSKHCVDVTLAFMIRPLFLGEPELERAIRKRVSDYLPEGIASLIREPMSLHATVLELMDYVLGGHVPYSTTGRVG